MMRPRALILLAPGTNRDGDAARALELAGAAPEIHPLKQLRQGGRAWRDYQMLVVAGGFSYADALGAGKLLALDLEHYFADEVQAFVAAGKPVIGICNGFQALVKSGILPGDAPPTATLTFNAGGHFECRWVTLKPVSQTCLWTCDLPGPIDCPVAHGEGNFTLSGLAWGAAAMTLQVADQVALVYSRPDGSPAGGIYPYNPNGSQLDIAGICNPAGNVLGLMPHPEDHVFSYQHPQWARTPCGSGRNSALPLFQNGVLYAANL
jgi:phosphoribosylformylglycinamidine synthase subunit PurQ / glutaminase